MTEKEAPETKPYLRIKHILPDNIGPRKHYMFSDPEKALRMLDKSTKKFQNESTAIKSKIDYKLLDNIRQKYQKKLMKLPNLATQPTPSRSISTNPISLKRISKRNISMSTDEKFSLEMTHSGAMPSRLKRIPKRNISVSTVDKSSNKLTRLNTLISDYSTAVPIGKSTSFLMNNKKSFSDLKERLDWMADDEIPQFHQEGLNKADQYFRFKRHEKNCNIANFLAPQIADQIRRENLDMTKHIQTHIGRNKLWKPSGENFPKRYDLQIIQVDRQLERLSKYGRF